MQSQTNTITASDIAAKLGIDPKTARAKLRATPSKELPKHPKGKWKFNKKDAAKVERVLAA